MAGNLRSGRKKTPKPVVASDDRPVMPSDLNAEGVQFWQDTIATCDHLTKLDSALCKTCSEAWQLYRKAHALAVNDPTEVPIRMAVTAYWNQWRTAMERLGIDPLGRLRVGDKINRKEVSPLDEFGIVG